MASAGNQLRETLAKTVAIGKAVSDTAAQVRAEKLAQTPGTATSTEGQTDGGSGNRTQTP